MRENAASGKNISRTGMQAAGLSWIIAGSMASAGTSASTGRKGFNSQVRPLRLSSYG